MAAGDALTKVVNIDDRRVVRALRSVEEALGGRESLSDTLLDLEDIDSHDPGIQKITLLARMLVDPKHQSKSLATLCSDVGLSVGKFLQLFHKAKGARALTVAISKLHDRLPEIADDIAKKSVTRKVRCWSCGGMGKRRDDKGAITKEPCPLCRGRGFDIEHSDVERQKLAAQITNLVQPAGSPKVQVNTQVNVEGQHPGIRTSAAFREATDRLLYPGKTQRADTVDAELVKGERG